MGRPTLWYMSTGMAVREFIFFAQTSKGLFRSSYPRHHLEPPSIVWLLHVASTVDELIG